MANKSLVCNLCNGEMQLYSGPRFSRKLGLGLVIGGILAMLFFIGPVLGIPLFLTGLYMIGAKRQLWVCQDCNTAMERVVLVSKKSTTEVKKTE